jgi:hypothetical protein
MLSRRTLLGSLGAALAAGGLAGRAVGADGAARRFIFLFAPGGWDPTRVFVDQSGGDVDVELLARARSRGDLRWVDHPERPSVRAFFEANADQSVILNGFQVRSIAHEICTMIAMTGSTGGDQPDWAARLGDDARDRFVLPSLVLSGPSFPADLGTAVARAGTQGQLEALLSGDALERNDAPKSGLIPPAESLVDRFLLRRANARAAAARQPTEAAITADFAAAAGRVADLKDLRYGLDLTTSGLLTQQIGVAVEALASDVSRCVSLAFAGADNTSWDSHATNDAVQSAHFEDLFAGLSLLMSRLRSTRTPGGALLLDDTTVVVLSEMGRTPKLNAQAGKDHWPYTSALLVGAGLRGGRVIGGYDAGHRGDLIDLSTGRSGDTLITAEHLGATLLALAGLPGDVDPIRAALA